MAAGDAENGGTLAGSITTRTAVDGDRDFLRRVYGSTREEELARVPWGDAERAAFIAMQFEAQHRSYHEHYPQGDFSIIVRDDLPVGRLYVHRGADEVRIIDIALLPAYRNLGIGTGVLRALLAEAAAAGKPLTIHVERFNPALRLYTRLGFRAIADGGVYLLLSRTPESRGSGEDGLVAQPALTGTERDQEELEGAERLMREAIDPLGQQRGGRAEEEEREGHPVASGGRRSERGDLGERQR